MNYGNHAPIDKQTETCPAGSDIRNRQPELRGMRIRSPAPKQRGTCHVGGSEIPHLSVSCFSLPNRKQDKFWSAPEKAGELAEKIGLKGDGKTRLLGFGLPTSTYELEEQLPNRIRSAFAAALAAYHKFLRGQLLMEKAVSLDHPQFRIQAKMKRVRAGIQRWHSSGKDPSAVGELMQGIQPLMIGGKLDELEKVLHQALEMLGETEAAPDVYGQD